MKMKIAACVVLLLIVLGMAHQIEVTVRPNTGRTGVHVAGGHED